MRKITVFMLLCLMMTTPYIGGEAQQEETVREAILPASHDAVRKSLSPTQKARIIREHQSLGIERLTSHVPKGLWRKNHRKVLTGLPTSIDSVAQLNSPFAHFVRRIFWKAGFSKTATRKIVKSYFPSNSQIKRGAKNQEITRGQFRYNLLVRQKALHMFLTKLVYGRHAIKGFDQHVENLERIASRRRSLLAEKGGYNPEDILRSEAEHKAKLKQLEDSTRASWENSLDYAEHSKIVNRVWQFATSFYSEAQLKALESFDMNVVKLLDEDNVSLVPFYSMMKNITYELKEKELEGRIGSWTTDKDGKPDDYVYEYPNAVLITDEHISNLLSNIPTLKADNVKSWKGTEALNLLAKAFKSALNKDSVRKELGFEERWKADYLPSLKKEQEKLTDDWRTVKKAHDESSAYLCFKQLTSAEAQLRELSMRRRDITPQFEISWFKETKPWESVNLSLSLLKDQFIDTHLTFSPEKLSIIHHPIMMTGNGITPAALADAMACEVREEDDEFITIARDFRHLGRDLDDMVAWSTAHGLPTTMHYRNMTLQELEDQCLASSIQLGLPNGVLKEMGQYINETQMEDQYFRSRWVGEVYDFRAKTPAQTASEKRSSSMSKMAKQFGFTEAKATKPAQKKSKKAKKATGVASSMKEMMNKFNFG